MQGNPTSYLGATLTWRHGRELATYRDNNAAVPRTYTYNYDSNGIRISKSYTDNQGNVHTTRYILDGSRVMRQIWDNYVCDYIYSENGKPIAFALSTNGGAYEYYFYETNLLGDITAVYNSNGDVIVRYAYDAWGNFFEYYYNNTAISPELNQAILFRYRGYIYDLESGLYYLQSRYYDPQVGRFINADNIDVLTATPMALTDKNLYAYCDNNPVMRADHGGEFWHILVGATAGAIINGVVKVASNIIEGKSITDGLGMAIVSGTLSGALASTGVGLVGMVIGNAAISMAENAVEQVIANDGFNNFDVGDMLIDGAIGGLSGAIGGAGKGSKHLTNLGKQTVKRTVNATKHNGLKSGIKEAGKAFAYYSKNTVTYYTSFKNGLFKDFLNTAGTTIFKNYVLRR